MPTAAWNGSWTRSLQMKGSYPAWRSPFKWALKTVACQIVREQVETPETLELLKTKIRESLTDEKIAEVAREIVEKWATKSMHVSW